MVAAQVASSELASPIENCGVQCFFSFAEAGDQFFGVLVVGFLAGFGLVFSFFVCFPQPE